MKLIKLELLNLASLDRNEGETINFEEGALAKTSIYSIVGPTGSGKSTILDAICLALYNRAPRYPKTKGEKKQGIVIYGQKDEGEQNRLAPTDCRNILTRGKKTGYSKLTFIANNGELYRAEWSVVKKVKNFSDPILSLYKITMKEGKPHEEVAEWNDLPKIIGLDYEQFLRTVLIAQGSFSSFIKAKENERYELLEKLIGCEELYSGIAARIKNKKDEAVAAYNEIMADFSAQEKDIIAEEELQILVDRIKALEEIENSIKGELLKISEALRWYEQEEKFIENINKFETALLEIKQKKEMMKEKEIMLKLHDATIEAVNLYKEIKHTEVSINDLEENLTNLTKEIKQQENNISTETETNLEKLKVELQKADEELNLQLPHIKKAREILTELEILQKSADEKKLSKQKSANAKEKADKDVENNQKAILKAGAGLEKLKNKYDEFLVKLKDDSDTLEKKVEASNQKLNEQLTKAKEKDLNTLQESQAKADKTFNDITDLIKIYKDIKSKKSDLYNNIENKNKINKKNKEISEKLKTYEISKLEKELETLRNTYTLMTSEKWEQHRSILQEGSPCPLCGSEHHPYIIEENLQPVVDSMKLLINDKAKNLEDQRRESETLSQSLSQNRGLLDGIDTMVDKLNKEINDLNEELETIKTAHVEWSDDETELQEMLPQVRANVEIAKKDLREYNDLLKKIEKLRKIKDEDEKEKQTFEKSMSEKKEKEEKKLNDAKTLLETEKGKTQNLLDQQKEKNEDLKNATAIYDKVLEEIKGKEVLLNKEVGDKNPDILEKELSDKKSDAENALNKKQNQIVKMRERLKELKGQETVFAAQKETEMKSLKERQKDLTKWLEDFNNKNEDHLQETDIVKLSDSDVNWEELRKELKQIEENFTSANTTLVNEKENQKKHLDKKPEEEKNSLEDRKTELEQHSNSELIDAKARLQRHENAKKELGALFEVKQKSEKYKQEWEEIMDAIGGDGVRLRKIAQCYTLRFLIEHANVEIRKFNNRYELQQVKNSLGIRVIDHDRADDVRDTTSLSGGETFIVSLGLALGLSSLSSRNICFENLFIDEGFGTLDPDTLATVIDSLAMLQTSQGKKVCVISHTDTMSERISTQIRIVKHGSTGSSHIEIFP